jgi:hypothetical protein
MDHGLEIYRAEKVEGTLEELFFELTVDNREQQPALSARQRSTA